MLGWGLDSKGGKIMGRTIDLKVNYGDVGLVINNSELNLTMKATASEIKRMEETITEALSQFSKEK